MSTVTREPRFTNQSSKAVDELERAVRARFYNLLEDKLRREGREVITNDDVRICYGDALREYASRLAE